MILLFFQKMRERIGMLRKPSINEPEQQSIQTIVKKNVQNWEKEYNSAYEEIVKEWIAGKKDISHNRVDYEAKNRARLEDLTQNIIKEVRSEIMDKKIIKLPNDKRKQEKAIEKYAHRLVNQQVRKIASKSEEKFQGERNRMKGLKKRKSALIDYRIVKQRIDSRRKGMG